MLLFLHFSLSCHKIMLFGGCIIWFGKSDHTKPKIKERSTTKSEKMMCVAYKKSSDINNSMASWLGDQPEPDAYIKSCLLPMWACSMRWKWGITSSLTLAYFYILILKQQITVLHKYTNPTWFFSFLTLFANLLWTSRCFFFF